MCIEHRTHTSDIDQNLRKLIYGINYIQPIHDEVGERRLRRRPNISPSPGQCLMFTASELLFHEPFKPPCRIYAQQGKLSIK